MKRQSLFQIDTSTSDRRKRKILDRAEENDKYLKTDREEEKYLQTQQTPKPEAQEPEATPPLALHSASEQFYIFLT